jgi:predicted GNAT family acetyltransferase
VFSGTTTTAERVVPPTSNDSSWRPGVHARDGAEGVVDAAGAEAGEDGADSFEVPPAQAATSAPIAETAAIATAGRRLTAPSFDRFMLAVYRHDERSVMDGSSDPLFALHRDMTEETPTVRDDRAEQRFVLEQGGGVGELVYEVEDGRLFLLHTEVADALKGHGAGGRLVRAAVARATDDDLTVIPWCPFARRWLREHPDVAGTVTIDWRTRPPSL